MSPRPSLQTAAALAAHRFGLGEARLDAIGADAQGWLQAQLGPALPAVGNELADAATALRRVADLQQVRQQRRASEASGVDAAAQEQAAAAPLRTLVQADVRSRLATAATTPRPFAERLARFWSNHFTVSDAKASARGLVGCFEREAIRPHIAGSFETLLKAAVHHPGMLRYLDNDQSAGPHSRLVQRLQRAPRGDGMPGPRITGLNENLAREILELHTLGVSGGGAAYGGWGPYGQADVTAFARVLTGWRVPLRAVLDGTARTGPQARFEPIWHEPGAKRVLDRSYAEGPDALDQVLHDLAVHPATARHLTFKLARHFVADEPPPALVAHLADTWQRTGGDLSAVYLDLLAQPNAWQPAPRKLKTPEEFVISAARLLQLGATPFDRIADGGTAVLGQRVHGAPSPAGWPDVADEWLGPDAMWKRVEWATRLADRAGRQVDARRLAVDSLGPLLGDNARQQIDRAADGPQALALLLLAPEFQRR